MLDRLPTLAATLSLLIATATGAQTTTNEATVGPSATTTAAPTEVRRHFKVLSPGQVDDYVATEIRSLSEKSDKIRMIVESAQGQKFLLTFERDYVKQTTSHEIREVGGQEFLRLRFQSPWTATTRTGTLEEGAKHPELIEKTDFSFEFATAGNGILAGGDFGLWNDMQNQREWRTRLRSMLAPQFLEALEIMWSNGFFASSVGNTFAEPVRYVVYRPDCGAPDDLRVEPALPDCDFDKKFGFPCSDRQKARADRALNAKPPSTKLY